MNTQAPIHCPACRYDLASLVNSDGVRCPECGGTFTYGDLTQSLRTRSVWWIPASIPVMWTTGVVVFLVGGGLGLSTPELLPIAFGISYLIGAAWCFATLGWSGVLVSHTQSKGEAMLYRVLLSAFLSALFYPIVFLGWFFIAIPIAGALRVL